MRSGFKIVFICLFVVILAACAENELSEPSCRINNHFASNHQGSAACVVVLSNKLLVLQLQPRAYNLAIAESNRSRSAQCSAHHAMWQQTGLNVEVGEVLGIHANGTWLFACNLNAGFDGTEPPFDAPPWSAKNVEKIAFIDPFLIEQDNWVSPEQFTVTRDAYVAQANKPAQ